jgi:hypothetical protein
MDFVPITVCVQTSDSSLVAVNNISLTGAGLTGSTSCYNLSLPTYVEDYTSTIIPETNASGVCSITFTAISEFGLTAITAFDLTITGGIPSISSMFTQTTLENLSTSLVFSITDTAGGMMSLTSYASDSLLVNADNIHLTHALMTQSSDSYTINVTAGIPETITLTIIPAENQFGDTQISILVTNPYGLTALSSFSLSVVESGARSIAFDGIDDHIISDADIAIPPTDAISIEAWIYLYTNTTDMAILSYGSDLHQSITFEHRPHNLDMRLRNSGIPILLLFGIYPQRHCRQINGIMYVQSGIIQPISENYTIELHGGESIIHVRRGNYRVI